MIHGINGLSAMLDGADKPAEADRLPLPRMWAYEDISWGEWVAEDSGSVKHAERTGTVGEYTVVERFRGPIAKRGAGKHATVSTYVLPTADMDRDLEDGEVDTTGAAVRELAKTDDDYTTVTCRSGYEAAWRDYLGNVFPARIDPTDWS